MKRQLQLLLALAAALLPPAAPLLPSAAALLPSDAPLLPTADVLLPSAAAAELTDGSCRYVKTVADCRHRHLTTVPAHLARNTTELLVGGNHIRRLDFTALGWLGSLIAINCSQAQVRRVLGSGVALPHLQQLDLSHNQLTHISTAMFRSFSRLQTLDLSHNGISVLDDAGLVLPKLRHLSLAHNHLATLSELVLVDLVELNVLNLAHNQIFRLADGSMANSNNYSLIDLSGNRLSRLNSGSLRGVRVETLRFNANLFQRIPSEALKNIKYVGSLLISSWPFQELSEQSFHKVNVLEITIKRAKLLENIQRRALDDLPLLERLTVADCHKLKYLNHEWLRRTPLLKFINLSGNSLITLSVRAVPSSMRRLEISGDRFLCDCSLKWLQHPPVRLAHLQVFSNISCFVSAAAPSNASSAPGTCSPTILPLFSANNTVKLGDNMVLQCASTGLPEPVIKWSLPNRSTLSENQCQSRVCVRQGRLVLKFVHKHDAGRYVCIASNSLSSVERASLVIVQEPRVELIPISVASTFATVSWNVTAGSILRFLLLQEPSSIPGTSTSYQVNNLGLQVHSFTFNHLTPGRRYRFWLAIQREQYILRLTSLDVTTRQAGFLLMRGRVTSYGMIAALVLPSLIFVTACVTSCLRKVHHWRRHRRNRTINQLARNGVLPSTSNNSDMAFLNLTANLPVSGDEDDASEVLLVVEECPNRVSAATNSDFIVDR